jgi:hypothetical protein
MLGREKEVVVFVKQGPVQCDQGLPLIMVKFVGGVSLRALIVVDLNAFALHKHEASVDTLHLSHQLLLGDRSRLGLLDNFRYIIILGGRESLSPGWEGVR